MIIDFRMRPPFKSFVNLFYSGSGGSLDLPWIPGTARSMPDLLQEMKKSDVAHAVVWGRVTSSPQASTDNADVAAIANEYKGLFTGLGGVCVRESVSTAVADVETAVGRLNLRGITVEPGFHMPPLKADDPKLYPIYRRCEELGGLLALTISGFVGPDLSYCNPTPVDRVAGDFPKLKIVISHACWPWVTQACGVALRRTNVYLLPDLYGFEMPGYLDLVGAANFFMSNRMLFGSAYPGGGLQQPIEAYKRNPYKTGVLDKVMSKNASDLLDLKG